MSERVTRALDYTRQGYNCAQAVACAYCDLFGVDRETAYRLAEGFGAGMGGLREVCGAVSGMTMLAGMKCSNGRLDGPRSKNTTYEMARRLGEEFQRKNGSIRCADLLGGGGRPKLRSCEGCIEDAARIVEKLLLEDRMEQYENEVKNGNGK